jgi:hypothetical protein
LTNGCAWNAVSAFANCGRAVAHVQGSYVPIGDKRFELKEDAAIEHRTCSPPELAIAFVYFLLDGDGASFRLFFQEARQRSRHCRVRLGC